MTLNTDVYVLGEIGRVDLFEFVLSQLLEFDNYQDSGIPRSRSQVVVEAEADTDYRTKQPKDTWTMETRIGQGLPAWFRMHYRPGQPYRTAEATCAENECWLEDGETCDGKYHDPACFIEFDMDTAYGYHGPSGLHCSGLHAIVIAHVYHWLKSQGVDMMWRNEYTGDLNQGLDGIEEFLGSGTNAMDWFNNIALPTIKQEITNQREAE